MSIKSQELAEVAHLLHADVRFYLGIGHEGRGNEVVVNGLTFSDWWLAAESELGRKIQANETAVDAWESGADPKEWCYSWAHGQEVRLALRSV